MEIKVEQKLCKPCELDPMGLFKVINGLVQTAYMTWILRIMNPLNCFINEVTMQKYIWNIQLSYRLWKTDSKS
jgi:hypothetical protein